MKWKTEFLDSVCERGSTHFGYLDEIEIMFKIRENCYQIIKYIYLIDIPLLTPF